MADKEFEIAGIMRAFPDVGTASNGRTLYAEGVALTSQVTGADVPNNRLRTEVKPADADSILEIMQDAVTATGTGVAVDLKGYKSVTFRVNGTSGTWNGGMQVTIDDTNWYYVQLVPVDTATPVNGGATQFNPSSATVDNLYTLPMLPFAVSQARFNLAARTSGVISVVSRKHPR